MSSPLSRFMHTARAILEQQDQVRLAPEQPPVIVRTQWLFVEIDEALAKSANLSQQIKIARLNTNVAEVARLSRDLHATLWQATELAAYVDKHFKREGV